jgi:hypothetical protein
MQPPLNLVPFAPKRRWFRFGLRTMFVSVTVFGIACGCLFWQWNQSRQRENLLAALAADGAQIMRIPAASSPFMLRTFGTTYIGEIRLPASKFSLADIERVRATFPEAKVELFSTFDGFQM